VIFPFGYVHYSISVYEASLFALTLSIFVVFVRLVMVCSTQGLGLPIALRLPLAFQILRRINLTFISAVWAFFSCLPLFSAFLPKTYIWLLRASRLDRIPYIRRVFWLLLPSSIGFLHCFWFALVLWFARSNSRLEGFWCTVRCCFWVCRLWFVCCLS